MSFRKVVVVAATLSLGFAIACSSSSTSSGSSGSSGASSTSSTSSSSGSPGASSSSGSSGGSSSGGSGFKSCPSPTQSACSQSDLDAYNGCLQNACDATFQECYGAGYKSGSFGGACATFIGCYAKCACNDMSCLTACGAPDANCQACSQKIAACNQGANCAKPACLTSSSSSGGSSGASSSGSSGSSGSAGATCADLQTCCDKIADATEKGACQQAHDQAAGNDSTCNTYYSGFKSLCP